MGKDIISKTARPDSPDANFWASIRRMRPSKLELLVCLLCSLALVIPSTAHSNGNLNHDNHVIQDTERMRGLQIGDSSLFATRANRVKIYVASWCVYCRQLEKFLKENRVPFDRFDIEKDAIGRARYLQLGGGAVPIAEINGTIVRGFSASEYRQLLKIK